MIDVTVADREAITKTQSWDKEVTYKGVLFFDAYIDAQREAGTKVGIGKTHTYQEWDDEAEEHYDEHVVIDGQEVYLGYVKSRDLFVMGFDMFAPDGYSAVAYMKFDGEKFKIIDTDEYGDLFYSEDSTLKALHKKFPDLLDIRLD
jgi:hypothetical protein